MRRLVFLVCAVPVVSLTAVFAGPASSGGLLLLLGPSSASSTGSLHGEHVPLHEGAVDLQTGLYVRENDDLVVQGTPALVLRRTYLSEYRVSKQFGIGATHPGEEYVIGDGATFQWAALVLASGTQIRFRRTSPGTTWYNAVYVHDETATEWRGAQLAWAGLGWVLRRPDGSMALFQSCGPAPDTICSIIQSRDADGHTIHYRRDDAGRLVRMDDGADRWIVFNYDDRGRIARAHASNGRESRYQYDARGRLVTVRAGEAGEYRYGYTDLDQLARIEEPGAVIENEYGGGRCTRQVNRYPDVEPYIFQFAYDVRDGKVVGADTLRSDGSFSQYTFGPMGPMSEVVGAEGIPPVVFTYERDERTREVAGLTVTCPDFGTGRASRSIEVTPGAEEEAKAALVSSCFDSAPRRP